MVESIQTNCEEMLKRIAAADATY
jgi:phosphoacetylglucosamine mutase